MTQVKKLSTRCKWFLDGLEHHSYIQYYILSVFEVTWCSIRCVVYFLRLDGFTVLSDKKSNLSVR